MKILVRDARGVRALEEGFASEEELQRFLKEHSDLMPLEEIELNAAPLLCIGWEVGLASGAEDILYIDETGLLTVVETKLRKNPEARREVVGQILEYAAQMATWTSADVERQAERFFAGPEAPKVRANFSLEKAMGTFLQSHGTGAGFSYEDFLRRVQTNIERGHFRLVIAIDEPPEPLLRTVEFVNRFSERFDIFLVQLKRFRDLTGDQNIFVPALYGNVTTTRPPRERERWNESRFIELLNSQQDPETVKYTLEIYGRFNQLSDEAYWGGGTTLGSFNLVVTTDQGRVNVGQVTSKGDLYVNFGGLLPKLPHDLVASLAGSLRGIKGITLPSDLTSKYPPIPKPVLKDAERRAQVLAALANFVEEVRRSA